MFGAPAWIQATTLARSAAWNTKVLMRGMLQLAAMAVQLGVRSAVSISVVEESLKKKLGTTDAVIPFQHSVALVPHTQKAAAAPPVEWHDPPLQVALPVGPKYVV